MKRPFLWVAGGFGAALGLLRLAAGNPPTPAPPRPFASRKPAGSVKAEGSPRWQLLWEQAAPGLHDLSLTDDARVIAWMDRGRVVRRLDPATGGVLWRTPPLPEFDALAAAPGGQVLLWKRYCAQRPSLSILDAATGLPGARRQSVSGAIWSVLVRSDGQGYLVGTGDRAVTEYALGTSAAPPMRRAVTGLPESLAMAEETQVAACGTWLRSGVCRLTTSMDWHFDGLDSARWYDVQLSADGSTLIALSAHGPRTSAASDPRLTLWDAATGQRLWERSVPGAEPRVRLSGDGSVVALTYAALSRYSTGDVMEKKLAIFDRSGNGIATEKGGAYLKPSLVAVSASGNRITVLDADRSLCTLDRLGRTVARLPLHDSINDGGREYSIREVRATADGQALLVYRGDGSLLYYHATAE